MSSFLAPDHQCTICLESMTGSFGVSLPCGHLYHKACLTELSNHTLFAAKKLCAVCKAPFEVPWLEIPTRLVVSIPSNRVARLGTESNLFYSQVLVQAVPFRRFKVDECVLRIADTKKFVREVTELEHHVAKFARCKECDERQMAASMVYCPSCMVAMCRGPCYKNHWPGCIGGGGGIFVADDDGELESLG